MNDIRRLENKLAQLGAAGQPRDGKGRELAAPETGNLLIGILHEIDETILARTVTFQNDSGSTMGLEIANRRLLCVSHLSPDFPSRFHNILLGQTFSESAGPLVDALADLFGVILSDTGNVFVTSARLDRVIDPSEIGCSPAGLAKAWALRLYPQSESAADMIDRWVTACAEVSTACIRLEGNQISQTGGDDQQVARLGKLAVGDLFGPDGKPNKNIHHAGEACCVVVGPDTETGQTIVYARNGDFSAILVVQSQSLSAIQAIWRDVIA